MGKVFAAVVVLLLVAGGLFVYINGIDSKSKKDQDELAKRVDALSQWGKQVSDWSDGMDREMKSQRSQNDAQIRQLNAIQTTLSGLATKIAADEKKTDEEKKDAIAAGIKKDVEEAKPAIDEKLAEREQQLPPQGSEEFEQEKKNLDDQRAAYQQIQGMAADPAAAFSDPDAAKKAGELGKQIDDQKKRVEGEIKTLEEKRTALLKERQELLAHDPLTDADKKRLAEIETELEELNQKLKRKKSEFDLLKMLGCLLKAVTYLGSFYADFQAPGSGEALRKISEEIPCDLGGGGKGKDGDEDGGGGHPPAPPPGPPPAPPGPQPAPPGPVPAPRPAPGPSPDPGLDTDPPTGDYLVNVKGTKFVYKKKGAADWTEHLSLTSKSLEVIKKGTVLAFDPEQKESEQKVVFVRDKGKVIDPNGKAVYMIFEGKDPEEYSKAFGAPTQP